VRGLREPKTDVDPLDREAVAAFLTACPVWWRPYFTVAFWTGARPNELAALRWGDVDGVRGVLRIRLRRYRGQEEPPKTASSVRDIDLLPAVVAALKVQKAQRLPSDSSTAAAPPSLARITSPPGRGLP
jgi:integrase